MSSQDHELVIQDERVTERRYAEEVRERQRAHPRPPSWTGTRVPDLPPVVSSEFAGRVALRGSDEMLGERRDFYLAERYANVDGVEVYSWNAPIACAFYRRNHQHDSFPGIRGLCEDVVAVRSFSHTKGEIDDYQDNFLAADSPENPFVNRGLVIPQAPRRQLPTRPTPQPANSAENEPDAPAAQADSSIYDGDGVRAEALLRAQLHAPRTDGLGPVLSTLQAEQYEFVTVPARESVVIEGKPGTGKTIVASHRAAYLVGEQTAPEGKVDGKVLVVGPTPGYSRHIRDVIERLADDRGRIVVLSVPELMQRLLRTTQEPEGVASRTWQDVDWTLGRLSTLAIDRHRSSQGSSPTVKRIYEYLRSNSVVAQPLTTKTEWSTYLRGLPTYEQARKLRCHWPLLAYISWEVEPPMELQSIKHVIVDEAQDVSEMEWYLLAKINGAQEHAWTILGDLNQRRSDHTHANWSKIFDVLTLASDTPVRRLERGYRSTKPILEFANRLLPRAERSFEAFQLGGLAPAVAKKRPNELGDAVVDEVARHISNYPSGTVAVISVSPDLVHRALRRRDWKASGNDLKRWQWGESVVTVLEPDAARGLEFDAVVVVEPEDFPTNYGRQGPLYTALTRGNRELSVFYSRALPDSLRQRRST